MKFYINSPFSAANKLPADAIKKTVVAIVDVLKSAIKQIIEQGPERISGELRDFMSVHSSKKDKTPEGYNILTEKIGGRTTYYTEQQKLY